MGIRRKVSLGFVVIGTILLLSSVISIYEFIRMRDSVSSLINDNIASINTSQMLVNVTDEYNLNLLKAVGTRDGLVMPDLEIDDRFINYLDQVKVSLTTNRERNLADSIHYAYTSYIIIMKQAPEIWSADYQSRRTWYFSRLHPVYLVLRDYLQKLTVTAQGELSENSMTLSNSFYRSIMPGVVAVSVGIILVLLFNYFLNFYLISPLLSISKGIKLYLTYKKSYTQQIGNDSDEISELNENVKELIDINKKLTKTRM